MKSAVATRARPSSRKTPASSPVSGPTRILSSPPASRTSGAIIAERSPGPILAAQPPVVAQAVRRNFRRNSAMAGIVTGTAGAKARCFLLIPADSGGAAALRYTIAAVSSVFPLKEGLHVPQAVDVAARRVHRHLRADLHRRRHRGFGTGRPGGRCLRPRPRGVGL